MVRIVIPSHHQTENRNGQTYTVYSIEVYFNGKSHRVHRRYRDFHSLHKELKKMVIGQRLPNFPPKRMRNLNLKFIELRRQSLEIYLQGVVRAQGLVNPLLEFLAIPQEMVTSKSNLIDSDEHHDNQELTTHGPLIAFTDDIYSSPCHSKASSSSSLPDIVVKGALDGFYSNDYRFN